MSICTCGAQHTSFPNNHSDWCDQQRFDKLKPIMIYNGLHVYDMEAFATLDHSADNSYFDGDRLYVRRKWFDNLTQPDKYEILEHSAILKKQRAYTLNYP